MDKLTRAYEIIKYFLDESIREIRLFGSGHINDTFLVKGDRKYVLQGLNTSIFKDPEGMMNNIMAVTRHIMEKTEKSGGDGERCTLKFLKTKDGGYLYNDGEDRSWRCYVFVEDTVTFDAVECPEDFYRCAKAFGEFQRLLSDFDANRLYPVIDNFHNTPWRYDNLMAAAERNASGRADDVKAELEFAMARKDFASTLEKAHSEGRLPLRVTHNDTKLNNILFDDETFEAVCVIDLDTVMSGYSVNDFGDAIRFGANTAVEDETDLSNVGLNLELFEVYAKGFIEGCCGRLTEEELDLLPTGAMMMTYECGMRFLTDHIDGDVYFRIHREGHNLDRCRNQFALLADMERKYGEMQAIINKFK